MEDYNINFQECLDKMTLQDLKKFMERLGKEFDKRFEAEKARIEEAQNNLNLLSD